MKKLFNPVLSVLSVAIVIGCVFGACQDNTATENDITFFDTDISEADDEIWEPGNEYDVVYEVVFVNEAPNTEVLAPISVDGLPNDILTTILYYEIGAPTDGSVPPLTDPILPYQAAVNYNVQSGVVAGTYTITITTDPDNDQVPSVSTTFDLTTTDPSAPSCNTDLIGNFAGPADCTPPGFGDINSDFTLNNNPNLIDIYVELYEPGSILAAELNCGASTFTIPQQTVTAGNGAQQLNVDGSGSWVIDQNGTSVTLILNSQLVGSSDPPNTCLLDLLMQ